MDQQDQLTLKKLLHQSARECGLHDIDHRELTRLIEQADAESKLLIRGASPGKDIFTSGGRELSIPPCSQGKGGEVDHGV